MDRNRKYVIKDTENPKSEKIIESSHTIKTDKQGR